MAKRFLAALALTLVLLLPTVVHAQGLRGEDIRGFIAAGNEEVTDCWRFTSCQERQGVTIQDVHIGPALDQVEEDLKEKKGLDTHHFEIFLTDKGDLYQLTWWIVCEYDANGDFLGCDGNSPGAQRAWSLQMRLHPDTEHLRLFPQGSANIEWLIKPEAKA